LQFGDLAGRVLHIARAVSDGELWHPTAAEPAFCSFSWWCYARAFWDGLGRR
jgi:hypothetical protein